MMSTRDEEGSPGHVVKAAERGSYAAARVIARGWHGGSDHNITGLSHGREWSDHGLLEEVDQLLDQERRSQKRTGAIAELEALKTFTDHSGIYVFWSLHGHRFLDENGNGSCLTCGAEYQLVHTSKTDLHRGRYRNSRGEDPVECIGWSRTHGGSECPVCHGDPMKTSGDIECRSCEAELVSPCNCLLCTG